jgi:hypothetical protein
MEVDVAYSNDFPGDSLALASAIAQLISDPHRRTLAEEADRRADQKNRTLVNVQTPVREQPAHDERETGRVAKADDLVPQV